jgi:hypothetical protein
MKPDSERNPRADAKLKRLSDAVKDEIVSRLLQPGVRQSDVLAWLSAEHGVACSPSVLTDFLSWWPARKRAKAREAAALAWMEQARAEHPEWTEEKLFSEGQRKFAIQAIAEDDPKAWAVTTAAADSRERVELERQKSTQRAELIALKREELKVKQRLATVAELKIGELLLKAANDARAQEIAGLSCSNEEKIRLLRQHYFSDVEALEQSGAVQLPPQA